MRCRNRRQAAEGSQGASIVTKLPMLVETEIDAMVDTVAHWVDVVGAMLTSEAGHILLRNHIRKMLREGAIETLKVIAAAEQGHRDADLALRELGAEMLDRGEMPNATLRSYHVSGPCAGCDAPIWVPRKSPVALPKICTHCAGPDGSTKPA